KYSLTPLIFGTLKATIYAMLFAAPIAIFAAIYTSEILHHKVRNTVKPVIEMMASLPSVVLGFIAAMVIAPFARDVLPAVLMAFFTVPVGALTAAYLWQLVPTRITAALSSMRHLAMVALVMGATVTATYTLSGPLERALFTPSDSDVLVLAGSTSEVPRSEWPASLRDSATLTPDDARLARHEGFYVLQGKLVRAAGSVTDAGPAKIIAQENLAEADIRRWLDGSIGTSWSGWFLLMTPTAFILITLLRQRFVDELLTRNASVRVGTKAAAMQLAKFTITVVASIAMATALAGFLSGIGLDARDSIFGSYSQRNTLVVAIVMGFAIIPIIYTISEDALSAVPGSLRSASLGCGATRWQTAIRVVLPIAGSGIFSACMIGLGRAAGETMIVLMATGNTPMMDLNIFSGFRTLAANIAVELPEAAKDSTHYRVLFLGALCLFALTFVVNTIAEVIRQRFRKRSAAL
ncbi:MAG: ABC transporter permease subunit, partial [Phycisphaerales bacterium]|nr:ABC transporter permease subunit [Phycisphaerales bacterium]